MAARFLRELVARLESYEGFQKAASPAESKLRCVQCLRTLEEERRLGGPGFFAIVGFDERKAYLCSLCARGF